MIRFEHVNFQYAGSETGVTDICLHVRKGECIVLTGPSGNGKTTLIRLVNGLAPAFYTGQFSGCIQIDGKDRSGEPLWKRGKTVAVCSKIQEANSSPLKCREKLLSVVKITASLMKKLFCGLIQLSGGFIWND